MQICQFKEEYQENVIALILEIQREEYGLDIGIEEQTDLLDITNHYLNQGCFWLALDDNDKVCGTIALITLENQASALKKMFVRKDLRRCGLGRRLLETCFAYCQQEAIREIYLGTVDQLVQAQKFYQNLGFERITKADLPKDFPVLELDNVFYRYIN